jgi:hypothetical protein
MLIVRWLVLDIFQGATSKLGKHFNNKRKARIHRGDQVSFDLLGFGNTLCFRLFHLSSSDKEQ